MLIVHIMDGAILKSVTREEHRILSSVLHLLDMTSSDRGMEEEDTSQWERFSLTHFWGSDRDEQFMVPLRRMLPSTRVLVLPYDLNRISRHNKFHTPLWMEGHC
jgi:hypothetical protein